MPSDSHLSLSELRALERQVDGEPAAADGTLAFLKDGMLEVISTAIAALEALERRSDGPTRGRPPSSARRPPL
jgi:hypothetical protein